MKSIVCLIGDGRMHPGIVGAVCYSDFDSLPTMESSFKLVKFNTLNERTLHCKMMAVASFAAKDFCATVEIAPK